MGILRDFEEAKRQIGEYSVMVDWGWRVEDTETVAFGSWSEDTQIDEGLKSLVGRIVKSIALDCRLPELVLSLDEGRWVHSFMVADGDPQWTLFLPDRSCLFVEQGRIVHERATAP